MKRRVLIALGVLALGAVLVIVGVTQIRIDALSEPGPIETYFANRAKHLLVHWSSGEGIPPAPTDLQASIKQGETLYSTDCAMCHGADGHSPTDNGRWMYPRASDLISPEVQKYTDRELFWIIKNGIRLSGMPAFGKVESDENIWHLTNHVRSLRGH